MSQSQLFDSTSEELGEIVFIEVNSKARLRAFRQLTKAWHGYKPKSDYVGRQLNYIINMDGSPVGTMGLGSPILLLPVRDEYIGWGRDQTYRENNPKWANLQKIGNNWRFTLKPDLPKNTGSKCLSILLRRARNDWPRKYGSKLVLLETLVEPPYTGKVYEGSGWTYVGDTSGFTGKRPDGSAVPFGKAKNDGRFNKLLKRDGVIKKVFVKPLHKYWKRELNRGLATTVNSSKGESLNREVGAEGTSRTVSSPDKEVDR